MIGALAKSIGGGVAALKVAASLAFKPIKYWIDASFRDSVTPQPGSVLYCDLWGGAEHSGIYVGNDKISNIEVDGIAQSTVRLSSPRDFTSKSWMGQQIYVSCDASGAVGDPDVASGASSHVGEQAFYGLIFKNCHAFSTRCVNYAQAQKKSASIADRLFSAVGLSDIESWESTIRKLKETAQHKLGATKWRLWDWENNPQRSPPPEPDWAAIRAQLESLPLNPQSIERIRAELAAVRAYEAEIADESIPPTVRAKLAGFSENLADIEKAYQQAENFLRQCPDAEFSYQDLKAYNNDWGALVEQIKNNPQIRELIRKLGRAYLSEEKKKKTKVPQASRSEIHGTHYSADLQRLLPSELLNLEDEHLELLFHARLLEHNLLSYELSGTLWKTKEETETQRHRTGPIVACLDTSASMSGTPLLKAKALLVAVASILKTEQRSLHVLMFGASGQLYEHAIEDPRETAGLLRFLQQGFGGGTDFETPLKRAFQIIDESKTYQKADVLMISDGDCSLSDAMISQVQARKQQLDCSVFSVLCAGQRKNDAFSDEVCSL